MNRAKKLSAPLAEQFIPPTTHRPIRDVAMALSAFIVCRTVLWTAQQFKRVTGKQPEELSTYADAVELLSDCIHDRSTAICRILDRRDQLILYTKVLTFTRGFGIRETQSYADNIWDIASVIFDPLEAIEGTEDPPNCLLGARLNRTIRRRMANLPEGLNDPEAILYAVRVNAEWSLAEICNAARLVEQASRDQDVTIGQSEQETTDLLLSQMTEEYQPAEQILRRAGIDNTGRSREILGQLSKKGVCSSRTGRNGGYRLSIPD